MCSRDSCCLPVVLFAWEYYYFPLKVVYLKLLKIATENDRTGFGPYDFRPYTVNTDGDGHQRRILCIQKYGTDQTVVQRYLTAKTDKSAIKSIAIGYIINRTYLDYYSCLSAQPYLFFINSKRLPEGVKAEAVFPYFMMTELPAGIIGFIVAALISAAICSLSADLNSAGCGWRGRLL